MENTNMLKAPEFTAMEKFFAPYTLFFTAAFYYTGLVFFKILPKESSGVNLL